MIPTDHQDWDEFEVVASRATDPYFYHAPYPEQMQPYGYQLGGVEYHLRRDHALFGDAPGLGKTAECVMLGNAIGAKHSIVVCPASLVLNWEKEIWKWSTLPNVSTYPVRKSSDGVSHAANYVILSYAMLTNPSILHALMARTWDHLILDEAHALKDPKGNKRTKVICAPDLLPSVVGRITMASGTILPNQPIECLGMNTLVLTDRGWRPIVDVGLDDLLWDGEDWVRHQGLIYQGQKQVMQFGGLEVTPDHEFLGRGRWRAAKYLAQNAQELFQTLALGSENLPSFASKEGRRAAFLECGCAVIAVESPTQPLKHTCMMDGPLNAGHAAPKPAFGYGGQAIVKSVLTVPFESGCFPECRTVSSAALTPTLPVMFRMARGELEFINAGSAIASIGSRISSACQAMLTQLWKSIASRLMKTISPATFVSLPESRTPAINVSSGSYSNGSTRLRPVYDLVNAGPRRRFTVLSDQGPMIAHNCYNAFRLLDWDGIDRCSLEEFRETYYGQGSGMVRGPVIENGVRVWKLHWSDEVLNVPRNLEDLQYRLRKSIMVRRLKEQVLHELPPKVWHPIPLSLTADIKRALKHPGWREASKLYDMDPGAFNGGIPIDGAISTARLELGVAKAPGVLAYIHDLLEGGVEKLVVGAWHREVLSVLRTGLDGYGLVYMDGSTSLNRKQAAVDSFQQDPAIRVILGQTQVLGEGWTLTAAQDLVNAEPDWVPGRNDQLLDRIHRIGQKGNYLIGHLPVAAGTLDERIVARAIAKDKHIHSALDRRVA